MIPYNPSSFNSNKTILEQILELKRWLQAHPSYEVFYSSEAGNTSQAITSYDLTAVTDPTNMEIGDVVVFHNSTFGVVTSVDTDNNEFGCDPCISLTGPQGATGPSGADGTNGTCIRYCNVNKNSNPNTTYAVTDITFSTGLQINDCILFKNNRIGFVDNISSGTFRVTKNIIIDGKDGQYVSNASIDENGDLIITLYDPESMLQSNINVGHVVGADGNNGVSITNVTIDGNSHLIVTLSDGNTIDAGSVSSGGSVELEIAYADIGQALSDSDYAVCQNADKMIVNYGAGQLIEYTRDVESSTEIKFARTYNSGVDVILVTKATKVVTNPTYKFIANSIDSQTATSGQVLQADGNGGASWQNAGGGGSGKYMHYYYVSGGNGVSIAFNLVLSQSTLYTNMSSLLTAIRTQYNITSGNPLFLSCSGRQHNQDVVFTYIQITDADMKVFTFTGTTHTNFSIATYTISSTNSKTIAL